MDLIENHKLYGFSEGDIYELGSALMSVAIEISTPHHNQYIPIAEVSMIMFRTTHGRMDIMGSAKMFENDQNQLLMIRF